MTRRRPEDQIQRAIVAHDRARATWGAYMFAVPNGGYRRPVEAAIMKATGTVAGIPDTVWIKDRRIYGLEIKAAGGRLSDAQRQAHDALRNPGAEVATAVGLDDALVRLEGWGLLTGTTS